MRILVACEFSGVVRRAFRSRGADAMAEQWGEGMTTKGGDK